MAKSIILTLTDAGRHEKGRRRDPREAYFTIGRASWEFLRGENGERELTIVTWDDQFRVLLSGNRGKERGGPPKNLRSRPATALGEWLDRNGAGPGIQVRFTRIASAVFFAEVLESTSAQLPLPLDRAA